MVPATLHLQKCREVCTLIWVPIEFNHSKIEAQGKREEVILLRWACEYKSSSGSIGLIIFSAKDLNAAQIYLEEMITYYGHTNVFNLNELAEGSIDELYRLFPRIAAVTERNGIPRKS